MFYVHTGITQHPPSTKEGMWKQMVQIISQHRWALSWARFSLQLADTEMGAMNVMCPITNGWAGILGHGDENSEWNILTVMFYFNCLLVNILILKLIACIPSEWRLEFLFTRFFRNRTISFFGLLLVPIFCKMTCPNKKFKCHLNQVFLICFILLSVFVQNTLNS